MKTILFAAALIFASSAKAQLKDDNYTLHQRLMIDSVFADTAAMRMNREITKMIQELYRLQNERIFLARPNLYFRKA